jgi:ribosome-associated protein
MSGRDLEVSRRLVIPAAELQESASRSGGPGGQHVNKTSTRVTLRWCVAQSASLSGAQRARLLRRLGSRLTRSGDLLVHARRFRSRGRNRELARERLAELVREALATPKTRVPTARSRSSRERALAAKRRRAQLKQRRGRVGDHES